MGLALACGMHGTGGVSAAPLIVLMEGNAFFSEGKIRELLVIPQNPELYSGGEWEAWSNDASAVIEEMYRDQGFFLARAEVTLGAEAWPDSLSARRATLKITEGSRFSFRQIALETGEAPALMQAEALRCKPGRGFDNDLIFKDRRDLLRVYGNAGFLHVKVGEIWRLDTAAQAVDLVFQVHAGKPLVFDTLILRNTREGGAASDAGLTREDLLQDLLGLKRGDTVSLRKTSAYERKLRSTHVFNGVRLKDSTLDSASGLTAMVLKTEERIPGEMELSAFYETQYGPGFSTSWTHANLGGRLHEAHALLSLAQMRQTLFLGYASLLLFRSPFRFDYDITGDWQQAEAKVRKEPFFGGDFNVENQSRLSRTFGSHFRYVAAAELRGRSVLMDPATRLRDFNLNWLNSGFLTYLDDFLNPTRGTRHGLTWGNGGPVFASGELNVVQERHNWFEVENAAYIPLWPWLNFALRVDGGRFFGEADLNAERFFLGGTRNVRSHDWRKVCPVADTSGNCRLTELAPAYFLASGELRLNPFPAKWALKDNGLRHLSGIQIVPFVDYGAIWEVGKALRPEGRGRSVGLGMRYVLFSLFNLRLDYALDPYRTESDGSRVSRWVIDLAQAF